MKASFTAGLQILIRQIPLIYLYHPVDSYIYPIQQQQQQSYKAAQASKALKLSFTSLHFTSNTTQALTERAMHVK